MTSTQTTVPVASVSTFDGHTLTMADLGGKVFFTIEPGTSKEEIVKCTSLSSLSWGTCTRGLAFYGTTETSVAANRQTHNAGSIVVMSNVHYVYEQLTDTDTAQTITAPWTVNAVWSFGYHPELSTGIYATTSSQFLTLGQAQALVNQGAATSTELVGGIVRLGTPTDNASSTWYGIYDPTVLQTRYASSTPTVRTKGIVPVTEDDGYLSQEWLDLTEEWSISPTGSISMFAATSSPSGWLICNGTAISRTIYSRLFSVIGTIYGNGNGSTTFNLPNMQQRVPMGLKTDAADGIAVMMGETGGATSTNMTVDQLAPHTHTTGVPGSKQVDNPPNTTAANYDGTAQSGSTGSGKDLPTLDPYITIQYIIKY